VEGELANIEEVEEEKVEEEEVASANAGGPSPESFLFDVASEDLVLKDNFDWASIGFQPSRTLLEGPSSLQGS